ncbi:(2Fe-2S)-binding protein [Flexivirga meconopsidis]|uniref:(2Fe-2S)-binding protein n=1 Tax=Flexivirga meconopsidis TaxID=2977121 RepID=UPI002240176B|nr:(2Fe-2S)-binding protein [Flexivirga meconopsidis]
MAHPLGEHLAFDLHDPSATPDASWSRMTELLSPAWLRQRVDTVQRLLRQPGGAPVERRVAASTAHLGIVAKLVAAHIGARALGWPGVVLSPGQVWCRETAGGPLAFSFAAATHPRDPLQDSVIETFTATVADSFAVSERVLWGNVGSAANSTVTLMRMSRPDLVPAATAEADTVLADPRIDGGGLRSGPGFRRRSCCLIYRAAGTREAICGDCVLG